jgi:transposase
MPCCTRPGVVRQHRRLHRIAVTQIRLDGLGAAYYRKRLDAGASKPEALRSLKRRLARVVFHHLHTDNENRIQPCQPAAA